jgi:hypothetical protein
VTGFDVATVDGLAKQQAIVLLREVDLALERGLADGVPLGELFRLSVQYEALSRLLFGHGLHP